MKMKELNEYVLAMDKIEAHEVLIMIQATTYPHQSKEDKTKTINRLKRICVVEQEELDSADLARALGFV